MAQLEADLEGFQWDGLGFNDVQFEALLKGDVKTAHGFAPGKWSEPPAEKPPEQQWKVIIDCKDESEQAELIEEFTRRALTFTAPSM